MGAGKDTGHIINGMQGFADIYVHVMVQNKNSPGEGSRSPGHLYFISLGRLGGIQASGLGSGGWAENLAC